MIDSWLEKFEAFMNDSAAFLWRQFEKDMEMTHAILDQAEKISTRLRNFLHL